MWLLQTFGWGRFFRLRRDKLESSEAIAEGYRSNGGCKELRPTVCLLSKHFIVVA